MSSDRPLKICVYGAGAIGGWIGVKLARAGHAVSFVARGATLTQIKAQGMTLVENGQTHRAQVPVSDNTADLGEQDLVIIAVKSPSVLNAAQHLSPLLQAHTVVMTAMNGVPWWFLQGFGGALAGTRLQAIDPTGEIARIIPIERIVGCVVHASCLQSQAGVVQQHFGNRLIIGEPSGQKTARVLRIAALLSAAGFEAPVSEQIQKDTWYKLWGNMTVNPVSALTGATTDFILDDPLVRNFISSIMLEAKEIGSRIGIPILTQPEERHAVTLKLGAFKTSMLQDVEAQRQVEIDALLTVVKELGELTGVATPQTDILLGLARLHARVRKLY
jgi:2-dehydropantoate 2-reductase